MQAKRNIWLTTLVAGALAVCGQSALGQASFPTLKGDNARTGKSGDLGPGKANLRWFHPNSGESRGASIIVDNDTPVLLAPSSGISSGPNSGTTLDDTTQAWTVNQWTGHVVSITSGTGAGQQRTIASNTATQLTVGTAWSTAPDTTSRYSINWLSTGGNSATTLNDTNQTWAVNQWANHLVSITGGTGSGQQRLIVSNTATSLTVSSAWTTATPDTTSIYSITVPTFSGAWASPPTDQEAGTPFIPPGASLLPAYDFVSTEASGSATPLPSGVGTSSVATLDPRVTLASETPGPGTISTTVATYTLTPSDNVARSYSLSAWIPQGPTGNPTVGFTFPQNHFVYEIDYGNGQVFVDVFDTRIQGTGWVQMGNGGNPTHLQFPYDGIHPIVIKIFDTTPRDASGALLDPTGTTLVYADAFKADPSIGQIVASPTVFGFGTEQRAISATNVYQSTVVNNQPTTISQGVVSSYDLTVPTGPVKWSWSPGNGNAGTIQDNLSAGVTAGVAFTSSTTATGFYATDYLASAMTNTLGSSDLVTYAPTLTDGTYDIYVWLAGDSNGQTFGHATQFEIDEGSTPTIVTVDESKGGGWVKLGNRKFAYVNATGNPLSVKITNYSADPTDATRTAYADAVWFVGTNTGTVMSSMASATVNLQLAPLPAAATATPVTIVCAADGTIYCLDAMGSGGTTKVYWTYPSQIPASVPTWSAGTTYDIANFVTGSDGKIYRSVQTANTGNNPVTDVTHVWWEFGDPNQDTGLDGPGGVAQMPTGFDISSALIQTVGGQDRLYIGASNGRVYCIDMAGRGDMNTTTGVPGTTTRVWSYPSDYPSAVVSSNLGAFKGSLAFKTITAGDTIFAGASQGRMYALDAVGNSVTKTTTARWQYPTSTAQTLGAITTTPAVDFGNVYFGTSMSNNGSTPGAFCAVNQDTGALVWSVSSTTDPLSGGATVNMDNFLGGPATASATQVGNPAGNPDVVFASNENRYIFAFDAATGNVLWQTNELNSGVSGTLTFSPMTVISNAGAPTPYPILLVPTSDGRFDGLFCRTPLGGVDPIDGRLNIKGTHRAYEFRAADSVSASIATGLGWMIAGDLGGNLFGFNDGTGLTGGPPPPGGVTTVENAPPGSGPDFSTAKIRFIKQSAYQQLRANPVGETYANIDAGVDDMTSTGYEWGQTLYAIVYNFPYADNGVSGTVLPPIVNFSLSIEGATLRQLSSESKLFPDRTDYPTDNFGGFAMLAFTIQGSGANALPPGHGAISISISSGAGTSDGSSETFTVVPTGTTIFSIANPLALVMHPNGSPPPAAQQIGYTTNPTDPENLVNGSPNVTGLESLLTSSAGIVSHGQSANAGIAVVDRSLMTILRGPGHGLDQVRVNRDDLVWNKGFLAGSVAKPLPAFAVNFEDLPVNYPNNSLDYPDIKRGTIKVTKDLSGNPENALFNGVSLFPPTYGVGQDLNSNPARNLTETPFTFEIDVPKYQPYNNQQDNDSSSTLVDAGYKGQMTVFVDSTGSGVFDITGKRQAFRTFSLAASVSEDERLSIGTPVVDLGALPIGTGFSPTAPWLSGSTFSPFTGPYAALFQPFVVNNDGNVNLVDLRLAHGTRRDTNPAVAWQIFAPANDFLGWLDGSYNLWSDIDDAFYFDKIGQHQVILQKARVGDRSPTQLSVDPYPRANANLNVVGGTANALVPGGPVGPPHVAVSVPLGFPSGTYSSVVRVIEDTSKTGPSAQNLDLNASNVPTESYGDPSFTLKFTAREAQLTNTYSKLTAPMADDLVPAGAPPLFTYQNVQPTATRDPVGNLIVAWASDRRDETSPTKAGIWAPPLPSQATTDPRLRIFVASVQGTNPSADTYGTSPLNDLNAFVPDPSTGSPATRWFQQEVGPFPSGAVDSLFGAAPGEVIPETAQFHYPSLPALGFADPLSPGTTFSSGVTMAFIGDAQLQKANGRIRESRLFATTVTSDSTGTIVTTAPVSMEGDINAAKGRPSVVQFAGNNAVIFYTSAGAGESVLNWVTFNGTTFGDPQQVKLPDGFESVEAPSAVARTYSGVNSLLASKPIIDLAFTGKLRGRANPEVFFGRIAADGSPAGTPVESAYLPSQTAEILTRESDPGLYRALGVAWNIPQMNWTSTTAYVRDDTVAFDGQYFVCIAATSTGEQPDAFPASWQSIFNLYYVINGTAHDLLYGDLWSGSITYQIGARVIGSDGKTYSSIVAANLGNDPVSSPGSWSLTQAQSKPAVDPSSGLITAETPLGRVYIDPSLGTVRFATAAPNPNATIALTYQPLFTRMSSGTASGYSLPSLMFDNRYVSDISYWRVPGDTAASVSDATLRNGRYLAIFSRAAAGAGQAARPFMTALRLGVKLPAAVATASDGTVASLTVTGNSGDYQIDPAQGKIYFTTVDEDQTVTVNFTGVDASGNSLSGLTITGKVGLIVERAEAPMPIDQAINESNVTSFIDPFDGVGGTPGPMQRPNLFWVFWSSTRGGGSDLFFQTLAPRFAPQVGGN